MIPEEDTQVVNAFIKYVTKYIGYLEKEMADENYNFNEIRILFELLENEKMYAKDIETELDLDKGYTSRILKRLLDDEIIKREQSDEDKRLYYLSFTPEGKELAIKLNKKYQKIIGYDYEKITEEDRQSFTKALQIIEHNYADELDEHDK